MDPIDGTQPFVSGLPTWCVSVAYVRDAAVVFGLVFTPSPTSSSPGVLASEPSSTAGRSARTPALPSRTD